MPESTSQKDTIEVTIDKSFIELVASIILDATGSDRKYSVGLSKGEIALQLKRAARMESDPNNPKELDDFLILVDLTLESSLNELLAKGLIEKSGSRNPHYPDTQIASFTDGDTGPPYYTYKVYNPQKSQPGGTITSHFMSVLNTNPELDDDEDTQPIFSVPPPADPDAYEQ